MAWINIQQAFTDSGGVGKYGLVDANRHVVVNVGDALPVGANTIGNVNAIQSGAWTVAATQSGAWSVSITGAVDTELPAASALSDILGNPTTPLIGAATLAFDGTQWLRIRGDVANGLDVDVTRVTGTVTVAGTVTANQGGSWTVAATQSGVWNITNITGTVSLPTGAATEATLATRLADSTFTTRINTLGQKLMAASTPVVLASDHSNVPISGSVTVSGTVTANQGGAWTVAATQSGTWNITNISGTVSLPTGASTLAEQQTQTTALQLIDDIVNAQDTALSKMAAMGAQFDDVATATVAENNIAALRITSARGLHANLRNAAGTEIGTAGAPLRIDPTGSTTQPISGTVTANQGGTWTVTQGGTWNIGTVTTVTTVSTLSNTTQLTPGTAATNLGKAEDGAHASGDVGVMSLAIRRDTPVANANVSADGDYLPFIADNLGKIWCADNQSEDAAHASGDRGSFILGVRNTSNTTSTSADRDYAPISTDLWDAPISGIRRASTTLTAINVAYDTTNETNTSATVDSSMFREGLFMCEVTEAGTATDIEFTLQMSNDGTTWFDYRVGPWVKYRFDDATIATYGTMTICEPFEILASNIRMKVITTGTDAAGNTFTVANARFELVN